MTGGGGPGARRRAGLVVLLAVWRRLAGVWRPRAAGVRLEPDGPPAAPVAAVVCARCGGPPGGSSRPRAHAPVRRARAPVGARDPVLPLELVAWLAIVPAVDGWGTGDLFGGGVP